MTQATQSVEILEQGTIKIPDLLWQELGLNTGDRLVIRVENNCLVLEKVITIKERLRQRFASLRGQNLIEELIADRRQEAHQESK